MRQNATICNGCLACSKRKGPFIYYVSTCRAEGEGFRKCQLLLICSKKNMLTQLRGGGEAKKPKNIYYVIYEWSPNEGGGTGA